MSGKGGLSAGLGGRDSRMCAGSRPVDDVRRRRREGAVSRVPTPLAMRSRSLRDAGRRRPVGRSSDPSCRPRPTVRAEAIAVARGAARISRPKSLNWSSLSAFTWSRHLRSVPAAAASVPTNRGSVTVANVKNLSPCAKTQVPRRVHSCDNGNFAKALIPKAARRRTAPAHAPH
jgi:hypothetical protein